MTWMLPLRRLPFNQIQQQPEAVGVDAGVNFLKEINAAGVIVQQRGQYPQEPQRAVGSAVSRHLAPVALQ